MKILGVKLSCVLLLLLLLLWLDRSDGLTDSSLSHIFFPFGTDEGDRIVTIGGSCDVAISIPYTIFGYRTLYVSVACVQRR